MGITWGRGMGMRETGGGVVGKGTERKREKGKEKKKIKK